MVSRRKKFESNVVHELLARESELLTFGERAGDFVGVPKFSPDSFRDTIHRSNWRPAGNVSSKDPFPFLASRPGVDACDFVATALRHASRQRSERNI